MKPISLHVAPLPLAHSVESAASRCAYNYKQNTYKSAPR